MMMTMATMTTMRTRDRKLLFPHLQQALCRCSVSMAVQTNVWQALILYKYGGLMTSYPVNRWCSSAKTTTSLGIAPLVKNKKQQSTWNPLG